MSNLALSTQAQQSHLENLLNGLPKLPHTVRYQDDFDDESRSLRNYPEENEFLLIIYGRKFTLDFVRFEASHRYLMKYLLVQWISDELAISSAFYYLIALSDLEPVRLTNLILAGPGAIKSEWAKLLTTDGLSNNVFSAVRRMLVFLAKFNLAGWSPLYYDFIRTTLPSPFKDKYAGIRTGEVFLSAPEEALIVSHLDDLSSQVLQSPTSVCQQQLEPGCMLLCAYLFGMRPIQIALLTLRDVRIWQDGELPNPAVHLTFKMVKQRSKSKAFPLTRRVKHEWTPLVVELYRRARSRGLSGGDRLFDVKSNWELGRAIKVLASELVGCDVSATDLRHTAAQRLVDAGASQEEVAEFMGHADITTCLVYFTSSPNQAERVNKALGISPIYQQVAKIGHTKFISPEELSQLKGDQQIAGVPHGIPIAGIGGCTTGQPSCPYNPITSCYGCQKFMPVTNIALHQQVLDDMRSVVNLFAASARGDGNSPAFLQLQRTIASIQAVINELETSDA